MIEGVLDFVGSGPAWIYRRLALAFSADGNAKVERVITRSMVVEQLAPRLCLPVALAAAVGAVADFGDNVDVDLYSTLAQVLPVLALAGFVELMSVMQTVMEEVDVSNSPDWEREFGHAVVQTSVYAFVGYLVLGEAAALWAVGSHRSTTFLLLAACFFGLLMIGYLTLVHIERYEPFIDKRSTKAAQRLEKAKHQTEGAF